MILYIEWWYPDLYLIFMSFFVLSLYVQLVDDGEGEGGDSEEEQGENASPVARMVHTQVDLE